MNSQPVSTPLTRLCPDYISDYLIAIDPVLDLSAESFTAVWNNQLAAGILIVWPR